MITEIFRNKRIACIEMLGNIVNRRFLVPIDRKTLNEFNKEYYEKLCDFNNSGNVITLFFRKKRDC